MLQKWFCSILLAVVWSLAAVRNATAAEALPIPEFVAQRHGLERSWFIQADIDRGRSRLLYMKLYDGVLYLISDSAVVQALDAETGATLWSKKIGRPEHPSMPLGVGGDMLAVVNGSRLYAVNRYNGDILYEHVVDGAPGGGPAVNDRRVYVPMTTGMIVAYRIDLVNDADKEASAGNKAQSPQVAEQLEAQRRQKFRVEQGPTRSLFFQAKGRTLVQPLILRESKDEEYVAWPTDLGYLYISRVDRHGDYNMDIRSRIKTDAAITVQPAYLPPTPKISPNIGVLFFGSNDGFVTAIQEDGVVLWRFPTGEPIVQPPAVIGDRVYFSTQYGGLYCVNAKPDEAGQAVRNWYAPGALQFLAASRKHVYAADRIGNTLILDAVSGARVDSLDTIKLSLKLTNSQTDRLYLATPEGLLQCLHEIDLKEPLRYDLEQKLATEKAKPASEKKAAAKTGEEGTPAKKAPAKAAPKEPEQPAEEKAPPEPALGNGAGAGAAEPVPAEKPAPKAPGDAENPFGEK